MGQTDEGKDARGPVQFGVLLRAHRIAACQSQEELAERAGLSQRAISDLERGTRRSPYPATVRRLADALDLKEREMAAMVLAARSTAKSSRAAVETPQLIQQRTSSATKKARREHHHNLPIELTTFVGREGELAQIKDVVRRNRLITLTGSGGVGKTRIALRAASESRTNYPDGAWFVDIAPLRDTTLLAHTVSAVLRTLNDRENSVLEALIRHLSNRTLLLVIDNCEHVLPPVASLVTSILERCPRVTVLCTSREALHVPGERVWIVPPLELPGDSDEHQLERLAHTQAIRLFVERAVAANQEFSLTPANLPAVVEICRRLDGIPLAIELAAARTRVLTPAEIVGHLDERFELFTVPIAAERQRTLRGLCDWSHDLLAEPERVLLRRLSVFAGGWTLAAAQVVCADGLGDPASILKLISDLVDKSIVLVRQQADHSRYAFHETLRHFAAEKLRAASEESEFRDRHLTWCVELASTIDADLRGPSVRSRLDQLGVEHDNLRAALGWGHDCPDRIKDALELASALAWYWWAREHSQEGCKWLERLLDRSESISAEQRSDAFRMAQARAFAALGLLYVRRGDHKAARPVVERSLASARSLDAPQLLAWPLLLLGQVELADGRPDRARALLEEGLVVSEQVASPQPYQFLSWLGHVAVAESRTDDADVLYDHQLRLARKREDKFFQAVALSNLSHMAIRRGDTTLARSRLAESLALMTDVATGDVPAVMADFVYIAVLEKSFLRALRLARAVEALLMSRGAKLQPSGLRKFAHHVQEARDGLSDTTAEAALADGRAMTLQEAVAYALTT
jgi:predicted ATPase/DNA-binding XRE family transcriptional regulator